MRFILVSVCKTETEMGTYTSNYNLFLPTVGETGWGTLVNGNFTTIDTTMKGLSNRITAVENEVNGNLSCTSVTTSGKVTANGGITSTTGTFSGAVTATKFEGLFNGWVAKTASYLGTPSANNRTVGSYLASVNNGQSCIIAGANSFSLNSTYNTATLYLNGYVHDNITCNVTEVIISSGWSIELYFGYTGGGGTAKFTGAFTKTITGNGRVALTTTDVQNALTKPVNLTVSGLSTSTVTPTVYISLTNNTGSNGSVVFYKKY